VITPRRALWALLAIHAILLAISIPDYRVSIDSGYHVSLARYYAEHGTAFWDHINFGPVGRPNLQGPALHFAIGMLGKVLGGTGDAFVLANAILAFAQWAAAMLTVVYFARLYGGDWAALFAAALISGSAFASYSFAVGIPSGWTFILAPWAIHFFLKDRWLLAALITSLAIYFHIASYAIVPSGILVAALIGRRWRSLLLTGAATVVITMPYTVHFLRNLAWFQGRKGHTAEELAPLIYLAAIGGLVLLVRNPRKHVFLIAWLASPAAWLVKDYTRFLTQATLAMAVIGGIAIAWLAERMRGRWRGSFATAVVLIATLAPLSLPSLAGEALWAAGIRYPRLLDWNEARQIAGVITRAGLTGRLIAPYNASQCIRFAVYAPLQFQKGHWVEVQPKVDPADDLSAGVKVYVMPLPPDDPVLREFADRGLVQVHGGGLLSVVTLPRAAQPDEIAAEVAHVVETEARWLSEHAVNNRMAPAEDFFSSQRLAERRRVQLEQRTHAGRLELATLVYAYALEATDPVTAKGVRGAARGFGNIANFLGDDATLDFISASRHERMRHNMAAVADAARRFGRDPRDIGELGAADRKLFDEFFSAA
jgi:hypothetical protein